MQKTRREKAIHYKLLFTILTIFIYLLGRSVSLYAIDKAAENAVLDAENLIAQTISGNRYSIFALGISPYMISSILVQMVLAFRSSDAKAKISPKKIKRVMLAATFLIACVQAFLRVQDLHFLATGDPIFLTQVIAGLEMVAGVTMIIWLSERNKRYGIGGQTALIFVNIVDGVLTNLVSSGKEELVLPIVVSVIVMFIMVIMENTEKRIPVQRISIHNIYADKNYLAIKLNPIGVMPAMFSTAFFMLPQLALGVLCATFPGEPMFLKIKDKMTLNDELGIIVYIIILYLLTIIFSRVFLNPSEMTEQFLKSGDSILNLHAGKETKRYLSKTIFHMSFVSATVMSACLAIPMFLQLQGNMPGSLVMLPASIMMLTGVWCNLYREAQSIKDYDSYEPFI